MATCKPWSDMDPTLEKLPSRIVRTLLQRQIAMGERKPRRVHVVQI